MIRPISMLVVTRKEFCWHTPENNPWTNHNICKWAVDLFEWSMYRVCILHQGKWPTEWYYFIMLFLNQSCSLAHNALKTKKTCWTVNNNTLYLSVIQYCAQYVAALSTHGFMSTIPGYLEVYWALELAAEVSLCSPCSHDMFTNTNRTGYGADGLNVTEDYYL